MLRKLLCWLGFHERGYNYNGVWKVTRVNTTQIDLVNGETVTFGAANGLLKEGQTVKVTGIRTCKHCWRV